MTTLPLISMMDFYATASVGAAFYSVKPNAELESRIVQDGGVTFTVPIGAGLSIVMSPEASIGAELLIHKTFTNYLDGYTSQYSAGNDLFYTVGFSSFTSSNLQNQNPLRGKKIK